MDNHGSRRLPRSFTEFLNAEDDEDIDELTGLPVGQLPEDVMPFVTDGDDELARQLASMDLNNVPYDVSAGQQGQQVGTDTLEVTKVKDEPLTETHRQGMQVSAEASRETIPEGVTDNTMRARQDEVSATTYGQIPMQPVQPAQIPVRVPGQAPVQVPGQEPMQVPAQVPSQAPAQAPSQTPAQTPARAPSQIPPRAPAPAPVRAPVQAPAQAPAQARAQDPAQAPARVPTQAPGQASFPAQAPGQLQTPSLPPPGQANKQALSTPSTLKNEPTPAKPEPATQPGPQRDGTKTAPSTPPQQTEPSGEQNPDDLSGFYEQFEKYLTLEESVDRDEKTLVLLSPLSYKHVFSRPWATKRYVQSIVERPQRLMACSLGISTAMTLFPQRFELRASTAKTNLDAPHVRRVHGPGWVERLYKLCDEADKKLAAGELEVPDDWNAGDIYLARGTVDAVEGVLGAVEAGVDEIFRPDGVNRVFVAIRPPGHHSHPCVPSGFCLVNNAHIAIQYARHKHDITHAVIFDFDLHHGDGTQDICMNLAGLETDFTAGDVEQEPQPTPPVNASPRKSRHAAAAAAAATAPPPKPKLALAYFSVHDINSFPTELGYANARDIANASMCVDSHGMCIWNVHLGSWANQDEFAVLYAAKYRVLFDKARQFLERGRAEALRNGLPYRPLVVMSAGFDASEYEYLSMQRHGVSVPTSFFNRFTRDALAVASEYAGGRVLSLLEGGYSDAALSTGLFSHLTGLADREWDATWLGTDVAKEFERGCKLKWNATTASSRSKLVADGIRIGRSLWPPDVRRQVAEANTVPATTGRRVGARVLADPAATPSRVLRSRRQ